MIKVFEKTIIFLSFFYILIISNAFGIGFTNVTDIAGVPGTGVGNGIAFVDYNNDGFLDIYVSSDPNDILYKNNGDGTFIDVTAEIGISFIGDGVGVAFGDYDNDGDLDLYIAVNDGWDMFFQNEGGKTFRNVTNNVKINNPGRARSASFVDFNKDGFLDIYVVNENSANILYKNINGRFFEDVAQSVGVAHQGPGRCHAWGDYDNDGDMDLYITNKGDFNILYRNDRGTFKDVTKEAGVEGAGSSTGIAFFDYNNDGNLDIYVGDSIKTFLYYNNGDGTFTNVAEKAGISPKIGSGSTPAFGDFDNDGYPDLYLAVWDGSAIMYHNNGDGTFTDVTVQWGIDAFGNGWSAAVGDYNNDGYLDIYTTYTTRQNILYRNNGNSNNWIQIKTIGELSNRDGIGTRVEIHVGNMLQIREVSAGTAYGSQDSLILEFGLANNSIVDIAEIRWQSGLITKLKNVKAKQLIIAKENFWAVKESYDDYNKLDNKIEKAKKLKDEKIILLQNYPNPFNPETWIPYQISVQSDVEINIYNSLGLKIRTLKLGNKMPGYYISKSKAAYWDGKDETGDTVPTGTYFYQLKAGNLYKTKKMVIIK